MTVQTLLNELVLRYKRPAFIGDDPISFPHQFRDNRRACELVAFVAALMSYGRRETIFRAVENVLDRMDGDPLQFVESYSPRRGNRAFKGFVYRFYKPEDMAFLLERLQVVYAEYGTLEGLFQACAQPENKNPVGSAQNPPYLDLAASLHGFRTCMAGERETYGTRFMFSDPLRGGACKRLNMFLRWMVRDDDVDLGLWKQELTAAQLVIPLDTHVGTVARKLGLLSRKANDWKSAEELTEKLQGFCPEDPVRYDFALFGLGIEQAAGESPAFISPALPV